MVGVNTLTAVDQSVYANHCQFWFRLGRSMPDYEFALNAPRRASIDRMRNQTAELALAHNFDYVCFVDDDVLVPITGLQSLLAADKDIVAGWTIIRGYPFDNMFFKWDEKGTGLNRWNDPPKETGLLEVGAVGFSFVLIKTSVLRQVPPPFFVTGPSNTEDIYFCVKAQKYVKDVSIYVDLDVKTSHCLGSEFIDPLNKASYTEYFKKTFPEMIESPGTKARADGYLNMIKNPTQENIDNYLERGN